MLYRGAQKVKLPNSSKILRLLSPLAIFLRFQAFQRYMITNVVFRWKVVLILGHLICCYTNMRATHLNCIHIMTKLAARDRSDI